MAKVDVIVEEAPIKSVILELTPLEAQTLHSLLGSMTTADVESFIKYGDAESLVDKSGVFEILDDELDTYSGYFKGTIG